MSPSSLDLSSNCTYPYFAGTTLSAVQLDPEKDYELRLKPSSIGNPLVGIHSVTLYSAYGPS